MALELFTFFPLLTKFKTLRLKISVPLLKLRLYLYFFKKVPKVPIVRLIMSGDTDQTFASPQWLKSARQWVASFAQQNFISQKSSCCKDVPKSSFLRFRCPNDANLYKYLHLKMKHYHFELISCKIGRIFDDMKFELFKHVLVLSFV